LSLTDHLYPIPIDRRDQSDYHVVEIFDLNNRREQPRQD